MVATAKPKSGWRKVFLLWNCALLVALLTVPKNLPPNQIITQFDPSFLNFGYIGIQSFKTANRAYYANLL